LNSGSESISGRRRSLRIACLTFALTGPAGLAIPGAAEAQDATLEIDVGASHSVPPAGGVGDASEYLNGGLRLSGFYDSGFYWHAGGFGGVSLNSEGADWASAMAGAGILAPVTTFLALGISATGEAFTVGSPVPYRGLTLRAEPHVRFGGDATWVSLRGFGGVGSSVVTVVRTFNRDTRFGRVTYDLGFDLVTDLWSWGGGLEVGHRLGPVTPRAAVELYRAPQGDYATGRLGIEAALRQAVLFVEGSAWDTPSGSEYSVIAGLQISVGGGSSLLAIGGRYGPDPLLDSPAAGAVGLTFSLRAASLGPSEESRIEVSGGSEPSVRIRLRAPDAASVAVMGEFTDWSEVPMSRDGKYWVLSLPVSKGAHHFGFLVDGQWYVPADAPGRTIDEWGGEQATLIVP